MPTPKKKVCVYAIAKNEEQFVDRFMDSAASADAVFVLDTGSTDGTVEKLRARGALVAQQVVSPWRFDVARNVAIDQCPNDCAILFSLDLDEVIAEPDWKDRLLHSWNGHNRGRYRYVWSQRADGSDGHRFTYEKIHTHDHEWFLPCHEILRRRPDRPGEDRWAEIDITVKHYPDAAKPRSSYLGLLQLATEEQPQNDRVAHYYGRELFFHGQWAEAIAALERHVQLPTATWADERAASMTMIAKCYEKLGNDSEAERWHLRACGEAPHMREPFVESARYYSERNRFPMGYALAKRAMQVNRRPASYITTPYAWNEGPYDLAATAAYYLGLKPESLAYARKAHELAPWDGRIAGNLQIIEWMCPDLTKQHPLPIIVCREAWAADPQFGLMIATYGSLPYLHLALAIREKLYPEVPALVIDDSSPDQERLARLAQQYGVDFHCNPMRLKHTRGDTLAFANGLRWAQRQGMDVLVKMSRRFIPKQDWRPSLRDIIGKTMHATYAGVLDGTWGLRTECIALHVPRWLPHAEELEAVAVYSTGLWVEKLIHDHAKQILPWGVGGTDGAAQWDFPGLGKWVKSDSHLWHDTADPSEYHALARSMGLDYSVGDFQ